MRRRSLLRTAPFAALGALVGLRATADAAVPVVVPEPMPRLVDRLQQLTDEEIARIRADWDALDRGKARAVVPMDTTHVHTIAGLDYIDGGTHSYAILPAGYFGHTHTTWRDERDTFPPGDARYLADA